MADSKRPAPERAGGADALLTRRRLITTGVAGMATAYGVTASGALGARRLRRKAAGTLTGGSNYSDAVPKKAMASVFAKFSKASGVQVKVNTVSHNTFQEQ